MQNQTKSFLPGSLSDPGIQFNNYGDDMAYAESKMVSRKVEAFLRKKLSQFWHIEKILPVQVTNLQYSGVDRLMIIPNQQPVRVEEKIRRQTRNDILIELVADNRHYLKHPRGLGWGLKDYTTDLLLYFFEDTQTGYVFHWEKFQKTLLKNLPEWYRLAESPNKNGFSLNKAFNKGYYSLNIAIPSRVFTKAYSDMGGLVL